MTNQIYVLKEKFGYIYCETCDTTMQYILFSFCEGHGFWWNVFFGWRKSIKIDDNSEKMFFWIPSKKIELLTLLARNLKKSLTN